MKRTLLLVLCALGLAGCGAIDNATTEGKNAFQTGMRTKEKAKDYAAKKESYDKQADDF